MTNDDDGMEVAVFSAVPKIETDGIELLLQWGSINGTGTARIFFSQDEAIHCIGLWIQAIQELQRRQDDVTEVRH